MRTLTLRRLRAPLASVATLALATLTHSALAGPIPLPFVATLEIKETVAFTYAAPCFGIGSLTGQGLALPLGKVTGASQDCINPVGAFDPNAPSYQFASYGPGVVFTVSPTEKLFAAYSGTLSYRANRPHLIKGHFVITGGTGKFAGATGGGSLDGYEDISAVVSGTGGVVFTGQILFGCQAGGSHCRTDSAD